MISGYHIAIWTAGILAAVVSWKVPHARWWVVALMVDYTASIIYLFIPKPTSLTLFGVDQVLYWPPLAVMVFIFDALVVVLVQEYGRTVWERNVLMRLMMLSLAIDLIYSSNSILSAPPVPGGEFYGIAMEAINYAALATIAGEGILKRLRERRRNRGDSRFAARLHALGMEWDREIPARPIFRKH